MDVNQSTLAFLSFLGINLSSASLIDVTEHEIIIENRIFRSMLSEVSSLIDQIVANYARIVISQIPIVTDLMNKELATQSISWNTQRKYVQYNHLPTLHEISHSYNRYLTKSGIQFQHIPTYQPPPPPGRFDLRPGMGRFGLPTPEQYDPANPGMGSSDQEEAGAGSSFLDDDQMK